EHQDAALLEFTRKLIRLRREHPSLHRRKFFSGRPIRGDVQDIVWFRHDGAPMTDQDWSNYQTQSLGVFLDGDGLDDQDDQGRPLHDDHLLLLLSASYLDLPFTLPELGGCGGWELVLDTADDAAPARKVAAGASVQLMGRSVQLYRCPSSGGRPGPGFGEVVIRSRERRGGPPRPPALMTTRQDVE
ncbi:MAG: hypothetical protein ACR2J4_00310, partial [Deinococcus sp.]